MSQVGQDYIRTRALNVEDSTRAVGAETQFDGWEKLRDKLRSLTESSCVQLLDGLPERKPSASALYSCEVVLPSDPTGAMTRIESQCRAEIEEMLRTYGFAVGSDRVVIDVTYVPDQFSVVVYPTQLKQMPKVGTYLFLEQSDRPMSAFRMNPADGSLELTGSSNSALLVKRRHRYPLRLSPQYPERSWVRFRNSDGRLQVFFLIDELRAQLVVDNIPEQIEQGTDWQDLPDRGVLRIASTEDVIDVQFELCRPPGPDVGRLSEFNIGGEMLPTYSQVEPGDVEYLKYYDCFNDAAAVLIREHFRKQNEEIAVINSKARAKLRIKGSFEAIAVAREVSIPNLTAGTRSMKRIREEGGRDGTKLIRRDDGSFVMASQVVITCMPAMEQMRNDPIAKRPGECRSLLEPMAVALDIAHAMHSFHGDIKPDNVCRNVISSPQWLTLIDTETFSSPSIPPASNHTPGVTDREHFKQVKQMGVVPQPHVLKRTDRRGFISVVLATWIGKVPAIRALARFEPLSTVVPELLLSVDGRQAIVAEVLDKYLERLGEDNSEWCQELLDSVEKAIDSHVTPARETVRMSRRNERAVREILDVAARASATSLIADTEVELERQVALIRRQVKVVGLLLTVVALAVVIVLVLLKMTGGA